MTGRIRTHKRCECGGRYVSVLDRRREEVALQCQCGRVPDAYYIDVWHQGKRIRLFRDRDGDILDSYRRADRLLEAIRHDIDGRRFDPSEYQHKQVSAHQGSVMLQRWYAEKVRENKAPTHLRSLRGYIRLYYDPVIGRMDCRDIRTIHVHDVMDRLPEHLSAKTRKNIATMLGNFCRWLVHLEVLHKLPSIPTVTTEEHAVQWITREDQEAVLAHVQPEHRPIMSFLLSHPVRPSEARALLRSDFDLDSGIVLIARTFSGDEIRTRKGKRPYYLPISSRWDTSCLSGMLPGAYAFTFRGRPYKPELIRREWHRARELAGVEHIRLYNAGRHSIASQARRDGISLDRIAGALGHSTTSVTQKYAALDVAQLRDVVDGVSVIRQRQRDGQK